MPAISMFYGIIIRMFNYDDKEHHQPHIHAQYQDDNAVFGIETGKILAGKIPNNAKSLFKHGSKFTKMSYLQIGNLQ